MVVVTHFFSFSAKLSEKDLHCTDIKKSHPLFYHPLNHKIIFYLLVQTGNEKARRIIPSGLSDLRHCRK